MPKFLRSQDGFYVYSFTCPKCEVSGEIGVPHFCTRLIEHGICGMLYIQVPATGMFAQPRLIEVTV